MPDINNILRELNKEYYENVNGNGKTAKSGEKQDKDDAVIKKQQKTAENLPKNLDEIITPKAEEGYKADDFDTPDNVKSPKNNNIEAKDIPMPENLSKNNLKKTKIEYTGNESLDELKEKENNLNEEIETRTQKNEESLKEAQTEVDEAQVSYDEAQVEFEEMNNEYTAQISEMENDILEQEQEIEQQQTEVDALEKSEQEAQINVENCQKALDAIIAKEPKQSDYTKTETDSEGNTITVPDVEAYNAAHAAWEAEKAEAEDDLQQAEEELQEIEEQLEEAEQQLAEMEQALTEAEIALAELQEEYLTSKTEAEENLMLLNQELKDANDKYQNAQNEYKTETAEIDEMKNTLAQVQSAIQKKEQEEAQQKDKEENQNTASVKGRNSYTSDDDMANIEKTKAEREKELQDELSLDEEKNDNKRIDNINKKTKNIENTLEQLANNPKNEDDIEKQLNLLTNSNKNLMNIPVINIKDEARKEYIKQKIELAAQRVNNLKDKAEHTIETLQDDKKECLLDPIGFSAENGTKYEFIVDDGNFSDASDFLGAFGGLDKVEAGYNTDKDTHLTSTELKNAGNIKIVKSVPDETKENGFRQEIINIEDMEKELGGVISFDLSTKKSDGNGGYNLEVSVEGKDIKLNGYSKIEDRNEIDKQNDYTIDTASLDDEQITAKELVSIDGKVSDDVWAQISIKYADKLEKNVQDAINGDSKDALKFLKAEARILENYSGNNDTINSCKELIQTTIETIKDAKKQEIKDRVEERRLKEAQEKEDVSKQITRGSIVYHYDENNKLLYKHKVSLETAPDLSNDTFANVNPIDGDTLKLNEYYKNREISTESSQIDEKYISDVAKSITNKLAEKFGIDAVDSSGRYTKEMESVYKQIYENNKDIFKQSGYTFAGKPTIADINSALANFSWDGDKSISDGSKVQNDSINLSGITPKKGAIAIYNSDGLQIQGSGKDITKYTIDDINDLKNKLYESIGVFEIGKIPDSMIVSEANRYYDKIGLYGVMSREVFQQAFEGYNTQMQYQNAALDFLKQADSDVISKLKPGITSKSKLYNQDNDNALWKYYQSNLKDSGLDFKNFVLSSVAYYNETTPGNLKNGTIDKTEQAELERYFGIFDTNPKDGKRYYTLIDFKELTHKEPLEMVIGSGTMSHNAGNSNVEGSKSTLSGYELVSYKYNSKGRYNRYLYGMEESVNDQSYNKSTVIHPTSKRTSWGCLAYKGVDHDTKSHSEENIRMLNEYFPMGTVIYTVPPTDAEGYKKLTKMFKSLLA